MVIIGKFVPLGISSFLTQLSIVVIMGVMNNVLVKYGAMSKYGADIPLTVPMLIFSYFLHQLFDTLPIVVCVYIAGS